MIYRIRMKKNYLIMVIRFLNSAGTPSDGMSVNIYHYTDLNFLTHFLL